MNQDDNYWQTLVQNLKASSLEGRTLAALAKHCRMSTLVPVPPALTDRVMREVTGQGPTEPAPNAVAFVDWLRSLIEELDEFIRRQTGRSLIGGGHFGHAGTAREIDIVQVSRPRGLPLVTITDSQTELEWEPILPLTSLERLAVSRVQGEASAPPVYQNGKWVLKSGSMPLVFAFTEAERFKSERTRIVIISPQGQDRMQAWAENYQILKDTKDLRLQIVAVSNMIRTVAQNICDVYAFDRTSLGQLPGRTAKKPLAKYEWDDMTVQPLINEVLTPMLEWLRQKSEQAGQYSGIASDE